MIFEIIIALAAGLLFGIITGLAPGIHINLVSVILISLSASFLKIVSPITLVVFIVSMSITHGFLDYIPSIFLGAPNDETSLSILPGHRLLLEGNAYYATILTLYGSMMGLLIILFFIPIFIYLLPIVYPYIERIMFIILIMVSCYLIYSERKSKLGALIIFLLAGFIGVATLNLSLQQPLLPLFSGLFGASNLLVSLNQKTKIPNQTIFPLRQIKLPKKSILESVIATIISAPITAFLPGLGASQAALIGGEVLDSEQDEKEFLFLLGAINTSVMGLSFIVLYSIDKTRTGSAVAVSQLIPNLTSSNLFIIILTIIVSGFLAFPLTILFSKLATKAINRIPYALLSKIILIILLIFVIIFSDNTFYGRAIGLLVFITSTALGIFTISLETKRGHLMGCLLMPTILFYLL